MNPLLMGPMERRLLVVERGLAGLGREIRRAQRDQVELGQGIWDEAGTIRRRPGTPTPTPTPPPAPNITFTIHVNGCIVGNLGGVGATVTISLSGTTLYTGTTDGGSNLTDSFYSGSPSGTVYDWSITPAGSRQVAQTFTRALATGTNGSFSRSLSPATGYHCSALAPLPLADTFDMSDTLFAGNHPMTWGPGGGGGWSSAFYGSGQATLVGSTGAFLYSTLTTSLVSISGAPPYTIVFSRGSRIWTITNA